jgi:hypothetical protein
MVNFHMSSCIDRSGEGDSQGFAPAGLFQLGLFRHEDQHPRRAFFDHVRKPSGGTTGGNSWENGSTANLNGPETIGGILRWGEGEDSWNLSA